MTTATKDPNVSFFQSVLTSVKAWTEEERKLFRDLFCRFLSPEKICEERGWTSEQFYEKRKLLLQRLYQSPN